MKSYWIFLLVLALSPCLTAAQEQEAPPMITRERAPSPSQVKLTQIIGGLTRPLYVTHAGDGSNRLFVVEQVGKIWIIEKGEEQAQPFLDVSSLITPAALAGQYSEQGLLGLAFHPDYQTSGRFYINYTDRAGSTVVSRYRVSDNPNVADASSGQIIFRIAQPYANHNGGHIAFGPDSYLYITLGDGGAANDPLGAGQNTLVLLGSILRIDVDGGLPYAIPADNPFVGDARGLDEIWAYGLRNVWRFSFDRYSGDLYLADVGQNQWEEVNFQPADSRGGENYGWNVWEGRHLFAGGRAENHIPPFAEYGRALGCSVTGGYVYRGGAIADLQAVYLFGDYCSGRVWASWRDSQLQWHTSEFLDVGFRISSFGEDEQGELYIVDYGGRLYRLDPT